MAKSSPDKEFSSTEELYHYKPKKRAGLRLTVMILAIASPVLAGYLITRTVPAQHILLAVDKVKLPPFVSFLLDFANVLVTHWYIFVLILIIIFLLLEILIKARWKVYIFYLLVSVVAWSVYLVYTKYLLLPGGGLDKIIRRQ